MSNSVVETLCELGYEKFRDELSAKSIRELITDFILPEVVKVGGQNTRGWRLSPLFMQLMTLHAQDFINGDEELGNLLFELAMQRIQRHPELKAIDYVALLPQEYQKYSADWDQAGLWGKEEWTFMELRLVDGLKLANPKYREHCKLLLLEIIKKVLPIKDSFDIWFPYGEKVPDNVFWQWAADAVDSLCLYGVKVDEIVELLLEENDWRSCKKFLHQCVWKHHVNWDVIFRNIDFEQEQYYRDISRWCLKVIGLYETKTMDCIKTEILCAVN